MNNVVDPLNSVYSMFSDLISCVPPILIKFFLICIVLWLFGAIYSNFKN